MPKGTPRGKCQLNAGHGGGKGDRRVKAKVETHDESGTATGHVKQPQRGNATEHAEHRQSVTLKYNTQTQQHIEEAQAHRADDTIKHMAFALESGISASTTLYTQLDFSNFEANCEDIVFKKIVESWHTIEGRDCYDGPELLLHKTCEMS